MHTNRSLVAQVILLTLLFPALAFAAEISSAAKWRLQFRKTFPSRLCKKDGDVRASFPMGRAECLKLASHFTEKCFFKNENEMPFTLNGSADERKWGEKIGDCARTSLLSSLKPTDVAGRQLASTDHANAETHNQVTISSSTTAYPTILSILALVCGGLFIAKKRTSPHATSPRRRKSRKTKKAA